jgi:hypothetical protein
MRTDTPGWLSLLSAFSPRRLLPFMLTALSLVSAARADVGHAPHWEDFDGASRYGYWESPYAEAGYWDDSAGYWDYSAGLGRWVVRYSNGRWETDQDGAVSFFEDSETVWVEEPVWVSVPQYVYYQPTWVDCPSVVENPDDIRVHSIKLTIEIRPEAFMHDVKVNSSLVWTPDGNGKVEVVERQSKIHNTAHIPFTGNGNAQIDGEPSSSSASVRMYGHAYTFLNPFQWRDPESDPREPSAADIDWDFTVDMYYPDPRVTDGNLWGCHDAFPSYHIDVDDSSAYDFRQLQDDSWWGISAGLIIPVNVYSQYFHVDR